MGYHRVPNNDLIPSLPTPPFDPDSLKKSSVDALPRVPVDDVKLPDPIQWSSIENLRKHYQKWKLQKEKAQWETLRRVAPGYSSSTPLLSTQAESTFKDPNSS
ncbi:hypothetical protein SPOG_04555 [Schizosaccharomyces cryophilus OY26]|uniref:Uncharacterized protein n=1 Tax=Schizosaccharomyces cryophilus (strain OY26 / ATCC MYA-4695 / CBS 11777 / NBRC 106824 / NRRL Y48691) TaxID=653667 RepID=S9X8I6_SCHCR|nr:uncharacterized protein SPOG_04555 [Schizosaccharomyces cryophilus OY26]EPY53442.1 hypothetical protein SPOG_04555 [Schizosaccharomyces cryophilus OY26]